MNNDASIGINLNLKTTQSNTKCLVFMFLHKTICCYQHFVFIVAICSSSSLVSIISDSVEPMAQLFTIMEIPETDAPCLLEQGMQALQTAEGDCDCVDCRRLQIAEGEAVPHWFTGFMIYILIQTVFVNCCFVCKSPWHNHLEIHFGNRPCLLYFTEILEYNILLCNSDKFFRLTYMSRVCGLEKHFKDFHI